MVLTGPLVHKVLRVQLGLRVLPEQMELMELILLSLDQRDLKGRLVQRVLLDKMEKRVQPAPKDLKVRLEMTGRMELPELLEPRGHKALLEMMVQTVLKAHKASKVLPGRMEPMVLRGHKVSKVLLVLMAMTEQTVRPDHKVPLDQLVLKDRQETTVPMVPRVLRGRRVWLVQTDKMEPLAQLGPRGHKGQQALMDKMEATVPLAQLERQDHRGQRVPMEAMGRQERKGRKEFRGQQVRMAQMVLRGHRVQPEPRGHKVHRVTLLYIQTSLPNNCQT